MTWSQLLASRKQSAMSAMSLLALGFTIVSYSRFVQAVPKRTGPILTDPLHAILSTSSTFIATLPLVLLIICAVLFTTVYRAHADRIFKVIRALTILLGMRMLYTWLLPVQTPSGWFPTVDATAIICLLSYLSNDKWMRIALSITALVAATASIASHSQYSIEVVLAPLAAWASVALAGARQETER